MKYDNTRNIRVLGAVVIILFVFGIVSYSLAQTAEAHKMKITSKKHQKLIRNKVCGSMLCSQQTVQPSGSGPSGHLAARNNTKCINPPGGPMYC